MCGYVPTGESITPITVSALSQPSSACLHPVPPIGSDIFFGFQRLWVKHSIGTSETNTVQRCPPYSFLPMQMTEKGIDAKETNPKAGHALQARCPGIAKRRENWQPSTIRIGEASHPGPTQEQQKHNVVINAEGIHSDHYNHIAGFSAEIKGTNSRPTLIDSRNSSRTPREPSNGQ